MGGRNLFPEEAQPEKKGRNLFAGSQPASPFLQRGMGMVQGAMATPPTGKQAALDARNAQIRERQRLADMARNAAAGARDARIEPVKEAGRTAAGAAMSDFSAGFETPKPNMLQSWLASGPQEMGVNRPVESAGIAAEREVFNKAGVMMPDVAAGSRLINSAALGLPAILNKDFRKTVVQAEEDQPGMALFGDLLGYAAPGSLVEAGLQGVSKAAAPLINRLTPKGGSALERGTRVTGRAVGLAGSGATQSGVYQATVGESIAAGKEGRAPSLAGSAEGFKTGVTDPVALFALPAALGANRFLTYIASGGATATPANIASQIDQVTGRLLNPRRAIGQTLDMDVAGADIRPQAMDRIIRELESAGLSVEDISRLMESVQQRLGSLPEAQASRLTLGQALAEATARDRPQALPTIMATLRERRLSGRKGDKSAGIISGVTQDLERTQIDYLSDSISRNIGDTTLPEVDEQIAAARREISNQYNQVLAQADPTRPEARGLAMIVAGDKSKGVLSRRATNAGFENVDAYIAARPDDAAHWLRSRLAKDARTAQGRERGELETTVAQLDELLETNPGYRQARMQWGHEAGLEEAQDWAKNFTNIARDEGAVADLLAELNRMPEAQRNVAMSSLRNEVLKSVRGGPEDAAVRLSKWMTRGALDALEQLGEGGQALANDLRFLNREQRWLFKVDPETLSPTAVRLLSAQTAQEAGNAPLSSMMTGAGQPSNIFQDVLISASAGQPLPIMTVQRGLQRASDAIFRPRTETLQDVARLYMGRSGNIPTPTERPDFTPLFNRGTPPVIPPPSGTPPAGAPPPQVPPGSTPPPQAPPPLTTGAPAMAAPAGAPVPPPIRTSGMVGNGDLTNAAYGAGLGGIAPAESPEERARNMAIGAGIGVGSRTVGKVLGVQGDDVARTAGAPRTPQQAVRFETPGSPEYEAAVAKGLDMSQAGRMGRAKEMGFDTETVLYHGTDAKFESFEAGRRDPGVWLTSDISNASSYAKGPDAQMHTLYIKPGKTLTINAGWEGGEVVFKSPDIDVDMSDWTNVDAANYARRNGYDTLIFPDGNKTESDYTAVVFNPKNIRDVDAAFDPDKAASPILTAGAGGRKPPKPDSPEAIRNALKGMAKPPKPPTRLEQMVDEGKGAVVPPINAMPSEAGAAGSKALRMLERGKTPLDIYDETSVALLPYNGANIPIVSSKMGPEELTRVFYGWLAEPPAKRPAWVKRIIDDAPKKKGMMLTQKVEPPPPPPPLPPPGFPIGGVALGAGAGILTGIPAGVVGGVLMAREQDRKRKQPPPPLPGGTRIGRPQ